MLYSRLCDCFWGYLWLSRFCRVIPALCFAYPLVFPFVDVEFFNLSFIIFDLHCYAGHVFFYFFFLAKGKKNTPTFFLNVKFLVCVKLFTTWESSVLCRCSLKEDTVLSGSAPGSQHVAQDFSNIIKKESFITRSFPAHTLTRFFTVWAEICEEKWATSSSALG